MATNHHPDHLGNRAETDASGNLVRTFGSFPFGENWHETGTADKWKFTTYERDNESGLDYEQFRHYSSGPGRFMGVDQVAGTLSIPQSLNRYSYVMNDPVNLVDPSGRKVDEFDLLALALTPYYPLLNWGEEGAPFLVLDTDHPFFPFLGILDLLASIGPDYLSIDPLQNQTDPQKAKAVIKNALKTKNLAKCLHRFFGPGNILTNENLPRIDATEDLSGAAIGRTYPDKVPETGRATVNIDKGDFNGLQADDPLLTGTYLHETANALAIERFTNIYPREARPYRGPLGGPPTPAQQHDFDKDIGDQFEACLHEEK